MLAMCWTCGAFETQLTTEATTSTTGSIMTAGGLGIQKKLSVGGDAILAGTATIGGVITLSVNTASTTSTTGAIKTAGGLGVQLNANVGGNLGVAGTAAITGNTAITGTVAITGATTTGVISSTATTASTTSTTGAITTEGGLGVQLNTHIGGNAQVAGTFTISGSCTGCGGRRRLADTTAITASNVNADFSAGFSTYQKDANKWNKKTHVPSAEITVSSASDAAQAETGAVCIVSPYITGTAHFC